MVVTIVRPVISTLNCLADPGDCHTESYTTQTHIRTSTRARSPRRKWVVPTSRPDNARNLPTITPPSIH